jgi:hypothetical protein
MATLFVGCSKNDEPEVFYTEKQEKVFVIFKGIWADIQFSNIGQGQLAHLLPEPDKIIFGNHLKEPIKVYKDDYMDDKVWLFDNQGECTYYNMPYKDAEYEIVECFYEVSKDADYFRLYRKDNNSLYGKYELSVKSETKFNLHDKDLSLPYIFVKQ